MAVVKVVVVTMAIVNEADDGDGTNDCRGGDDGVSE